MAESKATRGFTPEERAAMRAHARELRAARTGKTDGESDVRAAIAAMPEPDRGMCERLHALVRQTAPDLAPRTWYGMPAYARGDKVICFFQPASKFKARYLTLGFSDKASLDDGPMWPASYAVAKLTPAVEKRIVALVRQAIG